MRYATSCIGMQKTSDHAITGKMTTTNWKSNQNSQIESKRAAHKTIFSDTFSQWILVETLAWGLGQEEALMYYLGELGNIGLVHLINFCATWNAANSRRLYYDDRYMEIPVVSRIYFSAAFLTTAGCAMDLINPYYLYYNFDLIFFEGQVWRLFSSFLFFGLFSVDFLFNMYFLVSYCVETIF
jgi:hypothetical protein